MSERDDDDLAAAEYVLGTLDAEERASVAGRQAIDADFAARIEGWEARLAPLNDATRELDPPAEIWPAILRRLGFATTARPPHDDAVGRTVVMLNRSVRRWRGATALVTALAACLATVVVADIWRGPQGAQPTFVALLQRTDAAPAYVMRADLRGRTVAVRTLTAAAPAGRAYELWIIDPALGPPKSLGVLDPSTSRHELPPAAAPDVLARATYAVTEEPAGGAPGGVPSGAPIYLGHLVSSAF